MTFTDVIILIPSHSLEDFPTEQGEIPAAGLLNAFAVAWHPRFLATMPQLPRWHRADDPPHPQAGQLVFVPDVCEGWLPHGWVEQARAAEAVVVDHLHLREELLAAALAPLDPPELELDPELVADFLALGTCWLQVELLTRHMRNFGNIDEIRMQNRAIAAARATVAGDHETADAHLRSCFEILQEARERFYPVDCYLLDLCLVIPEVADDHLLSAINTSAAVNVLVTGEDLQQIAAQRPDIVQELNTGAAAGRIGILGAEQQETVAPVLPAASWLYQLTRGQESFQQVLGHQPKVWGRRRFGLSPAWPQVLKKLGYVGALHVVLDDGIYPDAELSRFRWQGSDGSIIEAFSRIPLAADGATTFLRFPVRMAESMDHDHVAAVCFARWPDVRAPWLADLRRSQKYAPVLGKFVTFEQLFATTGTPGRLTAHGAGEYFTPFLLQHVARRNADPLTRYSQHTQRRLEFDAANWCRSMAAALSGRSVESQEATEVESLLEAAGPDRTGSDAIAAVESRLGDARRDWPRELTQTLLGRGVPNAPGLMLLNPYRFGRRITIPWIAGVPLPPIEGTVRFTDEGTAEQPAAVTVDVPGCGFVWLSTSGATPRATPTRTVDGNRRLPPAEDWLLRNERFEVSFNEATGGILQVRHPQKRENRFSQLISFRYPRERQLPGGEDRPPSKSQYAETRCLGQQVLRDAGSVLELATHGEILDQLTGNRLASFRQQTRLLRHRPVIEFDVELSDVVVPDGDPWNHYFCVRFAWDSSSAAITRSLLDGAQAIGGDRFESTEYIEIADETERLTLIPHGLPFHRKTGPRMLDTLLIVSGETARKFHFSVAMDHPYPLEAARDATGPVIVVPTEVGFPKSGASGWLLHIDARNVQILRLLDLWEPTSDDTAAGTATRQDGFAVRVLETEGRGRTIQLRAFRQPVSARKRDLRGETLAVLTLAGDAVIVELAPYELAELELRFA